MSNTLTRTAVLIAELDKDAEHQRLKDTVVEAAKVWADHPETPKPYSEDIPLYDAVVKLVEYESTNAQTQPQHPR